MTNASVNSQRTQAAKRLVPSRAAPIGVGGRICVLRGALEGIEGLVCAVREDGRYILALDDLPSGVYIALEEDAIMAVSGQASGV